MSFRLKSAEEFAQDQTAQCRGAARETERYPFLAELGGSDWPSATMRQRQDARWTADAPQIHSRRGDEQRQSSRLLTQMPVVPACPPGLLPYVRGPTETSLCQSHGQSTFAQSPNGARGYKSALVVTPLPHERSALNSRAKNGDDAL